MSRYMPENWAVPLIEDHNREFFTTGKVMLQQCTDCQTVQHPPEEVCHHCGGMEFTYLESEGEGTVYSYAVMHYPAHADLQTKVPYGVVLVELDDYPHVRITGNCLNVEPANLEIGMKVRVTWEEVSDKEAGEEIKLPQWEAV